MSDILLFSKKTDWCRKVHHHARRLWGQRLSVIEGEVGESFHEVPEGKFSLIISYLSPWIIPQNLLSQATLALNFHPGTRDYPGIGCYNFALYEETGNFGSVCHHMEAKVDTGSIIDETRFPVTKDETVASLKEKTMAAMYDQFCRISGRYDAGILPRASIQWARRPFTRKELNALCEVTPDMSEAEIKRRVRATAYPGFPGAYVTLAGIRFSA